MHSASGGPATQVHPGHSLIGAARHRDPFGPLFGAVPASLVLDAEHLSADVSACCCYGRINEDCRGNWENWEPTRRPVMSLFTVRSFSRGKKMHSK